MTDPLRDLLPVPAALEPLIACIRARMDPDAIWLFGSRARGDNRPDSDWDLLVSLADEAPADLLDPLAGWEVQRSAGVSATVLTARSSDIAALWGVPNTIGYDLSKHGRRLDV